MGTIAEITRRALPQTELKGNTTSSTETGGCMFSATTSGGVGRCTVHQELRSNGGTPCVADEEAGDLVSLKY